MLGKYIGSIVRGIEHVTGKIRRSDEPVRRPAWLRLPSIEAFNFIFWHYMYIIIMAMVGSWILIGDRNIDYIDALFFAAGGSTQSGLNTVDVNLLKTYQQITLLLMACLCNPIVINMFVVFVRLYWFEKRFQHVVRSANDFRKARTRSRSKSMDARDLEHGTNAPAAGVAGREIKIVRMAPSTTNEKEPDKREAEMQQSGSERTGSTTDGEDVPDEKLNKQESAKNTEVPFQRNITFADEVKRHQRSNSNEPRLPGQRSPEQHIAFVENQRRPKDTGTLRIPGPRDFDRGDLPQLVHEDEDEPEQDVARPMSHDFGKTEDRHGGHGYNMDDNQSKAETTGEDEGNKFRKFGDKVRALRRNSNAGNDNTPKLSFKERALSGGRSFTRFLSQDRADMDPNPYLSYAPTIGRNSLFINLTEEQREELGGIEYRALKTLAYILMIYFWGWAIFSIVTFLPWIMTSDDYKPVVRNDGQGVPWWGIFTGVSHFTDLGFTLTPDSMVSFQTAVLPMLVGSFLIIIGNTGFPIMLRFMIWCASLVVRRGSGIWEELRFLLDHPRRCFTLLFPKRATWWLFAVLVILNAIDLIFFVILDLHDETVTSLPPGFQFLDGVYQAASTRTAGFSCVNLADLHPGIQVSYLIMMYISVFPIAISVRQTNVYEENSLGIYGTAGDSDDDPDDPQTHSHSYIGSHLRRQLSFDLWYVFLGLFLICIIEGDRLANTNEYAFTIFSVLFEIVSAYGTVGLSLGYPDTNASFSAQFKTLSKLIIIAMMIRGRHRGLPYALDRAILLPSESLQKHEREEDVKRMERRASMTSAHHHLAAVSLPNTSNAVHHQTAGTGVLNPNATIENSAQSRVTSHSLPLPNFGPRSISVAPTVHDDESPAFRPVFGTSHTTSGDGSGGGRKRHRITRIISGALSAGPTNKKRA